MQEKITSGVPLLEILVARQVITAAADKFFKRLWVQAKREKKSCRLYRSLFLDMKTEFFKLRIIRSCTRSQDQFLLAKV